jgi:hypothetical protein
LLEGAFERRSLSSEKRTPSTFDEIGFPQDCEKDRPDPAMITGCAIDWPFPSVP